MEYVLLIFNSKDEQSIMATQWTARQRPAESRTRGRAHLASTDKTVVNAIKRSRLKYCKLHRPYQPPHRINVINVGSLSQYTLFTFRCVLDFKLPKLETVDNDIKLGPYRPVYLANYLLNICILTTLFLLFYNIPLLAKCLYLGFPTSFSRSNHLPPVCLTKLTIDIVFYKYTYYFRNPVMI